MSLQPPVHPLLLDPGYTPLKHHLIESTGLAYYADKDRDLAARISARLSVLTLGTCGAYLDLLQDRSAGESERHLLIGQLTIGETYFFRHTEQFDGLRDAAIPDLIERNRDRRTLRIWSAGCAIGAEPYTLAILLKQHFADRLAGWDVQIIGTDINQAFLARAARGEFDDRALRSTSDEVKRQWFSPSAGGSWIVRPFVKEWVSFQYHNLVEHPYPSVVHGIAALDLILCRNVMIYFDWDVIARILGRFHECLVDGGWLAVGHAESNPDAFRAFRTVSVPGATLYQKSGDTVPLHTYSPAPLPDHAFWPLPQEAQPSWVPPALPDVPGVPQSVLHPGQTPAALSGLAHVRHLADAGQWTKAAEACRQWIDRDQLDPAGHFYHALILEQMREQENAEQAFRRAIYLDRAFVLAHYHLALLLGKSGRPASAVQSLRNVQRLLAGMNRQQPIAEGDGLTADDLGQFANLQIEVWER